MTKQKIEINLPATLSYSALVRHVSDEIFTEAGFTKEWVGRLKLVVDELYMNAVKYGSTENKSIVNVEFLYDETEIQFVIQDDGTGERKMSAEDLKKVIENNTKNSTVTQTSGRGLALIANLWTDNLTVEQSSNGGIRISFFKKIKNAVPPLQPPLIQTAISKQQEIVGVQEKLQPKGPDYTVKLHGEIDQHNIELIVAPVIQKIQSLPDGGRLILDFSDVSYINSTVIGHLASWYNEIKKKNGQVVIKNANAQILDVLDLVGLGKILSIENK